MEDEMKVTAKRSHVNAKFFIIFLNGKPWRVCHETQLDERYPNATVEEN